MRKSLSILLTSGLLASIATACSSSGDSASSSSAPKDSAAASTAPTATAAPATPAAPEVIKIFMAGGATFPDGADINKNPWVELIEKENNVDLQIEYGPAASQEYVNKLTLKFASNDIPDLFFLASSYQNWLMQNAELGALMSLDDKIDKYPNLKKNISPTNWEAVKYNGKAYAVPVLNDGNKATNNVYVRKDWLDKLKLDIPKTLEDYEKVAKAFRDQDPDGNGKNDTKGLVAYDNMLGWSHMFGAFGVIPGHWIEKDGNIVYSDIQPEMKEALTYLNKIYKEKLLDNEWPVMQIKTYNELVANNKVGLYSNSWSAPRGEINTSKTNDPKANWIPIPPPVGPKGKQGQFGGTDLKSMAVISSKAKNVDAILRMLNWMAVPENIDKFVFGFGDKGEGFMYTVKDGKYLLNFENHNKYGYRQQLMFMQPYELNRKKMESLGAEFNLVGTIEHSVKYQIPNKFVGAPTPGMIENQAKLDQLSKETFTKIIVGELPVSAFDSFVKDFNAKGGEKITAEVQKWYAGTKK